MIEKNNYIRPEVQSGMPDAFWPTHLSPKVVKDAYGVRLCGFTIALEAWRRGLDVIVNSHKASAFQSFAIKSSVKSLSFNRARIIDLNTREAVSTVVDKDATRLALIEANVPAPVGKKFSAESHYNAPCEYAASIGWPVVIKPLSGSLGRGVYTNIKNEVEFLSYCTHVVENLHVNDFVVEKHILGDDYRVLANREKVFAAAKRIPANIVGNGHDSIKKLISEKNNLRKQNPNYSKGLIKIDKEVRYYIEKEGYELNSVPPAGVALFLRGKANTSSGGDLIDVTDTLPSAVMTASINAIVAIKGLEFGGVDLVYDTVTDEFSVIEINSRPQISHMYPTEGIGRDVPRMLIDTYFPEAPLGHEEINPYLVFDVARILAPLECRSVESLVIAPATMFKRFKRKYYALNNCSFENKANILLRLNVLSKKFNIIGTVMRKNTTALEMRLAGNHSSIEKFVSHVEVLMCSDSSRSDNWTGIVKNSFIVNLDE